MGNEAIRTSLFLCSSKYYLEHEHNYHVHFTYGFL